MDRRNFLRNTATAALVGGIGSAAIAAASKSSGSSSPDKKITPALCLVYGQLDQTGGRIAEQIELLKSLGIPSDIAVGLNYDSKTLAVLNDWSDRGNLVSSSFYPYNLDPNCPDANWHTYDEETCERLLIEAKKRVFKAGFKKFDAINTYTPGNGFVRAAKKVGIHYLTGFCGPTFANDTHWKFAQYGSPLTPYFASNDDFRKPEVPKGNEWIQFANMELRSPLTCLENWNEGPFCPLNLVMGDRSIEPGDLPVETMAIVTDWLEMSRLTDTPRLIIVNLQYFTSLKCFGLNKQLLTWLAEQRDLGRLQFTSMQEIAKKNLAVGGFTPQTTWWRGENMGMQVGGQAGDGNPCIVHETIAGQWVWRVGQAGPERAYDYTKKWDYPPFDPTASLPESFGYQASVSSKQKVNANELEVQLDWDAGSASIVYLCAWKALDGFAAPFKIESITGITSAEAIPHPSGQGGAIIFKASDSKGSGKVKITHSGVATDSYTRRIEDLMVAETCWIQGRPITRLATLVPYRFKFPVSLKGPLTSRWEAIVDGKISTGMLYPGAKIEAILDGTRSGSMIRFWDVTVADLAIPDDVLKNERIRLTQEVKAIAAELAPHSPQPTAPPLLGALANISEWAKVAAKNGADKEIQRIEQARAKYAPGKFISASHMACELPYGSRGRTRSGMYNRSEQSGKVDFFEIFYDYGQSYAPGVAGWNQFVQVSFGIRNHEKGKPYKLVIHTFDPEARGTSVRLSAHSGSYDALVGKGRNFDLTEWKEIAQGMENRFEANAFIVIDLPVELTLEDSIMFDLHGNSEKVKYDRLTESFGFVFLSHTWLLDSKA